jgi:hypothetical protein
MIKKLTRFQLFILASILFFVAFSLILFAVYPNYTLDFATIRLAISLFTAVLLVAIAFRHPKRTTAVIPSFNIDIEKIESLKRFHVEFVIVENSYLPEIRKSLSESALIEAPLSDTESSLLVVGTTDQADSISEILRRFHARAASARITVSSVSIV